MSFQSSFDGIVVLHAAFLYPERRQHFEAELHRIGVTRHHVLHTKPVTEEDERLRRYTGRACGLLSLTDGFLSAIDMAASNGWTSVAILEDDILFRRSFVRLWEDVEPQIHTTQWGVLTLHRMPTDGSFLIEEPTFSKTGLVPVVHNTLNHCVIVRSGYYEAFRASLYHCIDRGYPCDFFYGIFSHLNPLRLYSTNRQLTGQAGNLESGLNQGYRRSTNVYSAFRGGTRLECAILNPLHYVGRRLSETIR